MKPIITQTPTPEENPNKLPQEKYNEILTNSIFPTLSKNKLTKTKTKWETFKAKVANAKDIVKFNIVFNMNTPANTSAESSDDKSINIFHNKYEMVDQKIEYKRKISSLIYCSYRKNFEPIRNYKNPNDFLTSDCGWGCMIRSSQMILSRALYRLFYYIDKTKNEEYLDQYLQEDLHLKSRVRTILLMMELPVSQADFCIKMKKLYYTQIDCMKNINDMTIKVIPPFSIANICSIGELYGKSAGEWFSDVTLPQIYNKMNESFDIVPNLAIIHFHSTIEHEAIISRCFTKINANDINQNTENINRNNNEIDQTSLNQNKEKEKEIIHYNDKTYLFTKTGLVFLSVRLGINTIPIEYHESIKRVFDFKNCIGIIGGKGSTAYYFIGYSQQSFLYLDPLLAQECTKDLGSESYNVKSVFQLNFNQMQTAFTIGFQFRSFEEYKDIITFFIKETKNKYPIFSYSQKTTPYDSIIITSQNNDNDDF